MGLHELSLVELSDQLRQGEVTSVEAVEALIVRRAEVDSDVRALVHSFDEEALAAAKAADEARRQGDKRPLLGVPVTIKESIDTVGVASTLGLKSRQGSPANSDAVVVDLLRRAGAIVVGKTNVSQLLLFHESENAIFGATNNPWNVERVPGGSSGGEAAAIAAGLSFGGIGTDIGGSIRIPCAFTGIAGLKPTVDRWSNVGCHTALAGQELIRGQNGPMARESRDVQLLFSTLHPLLHAAIDPAVPPLPLGDPSEIDLSGLRVGVYESDGFFEPAASVRRATREAAAWAADAGAEIVEFTPVDAEDLIYTYMAGISSDGGETVDRLLGSETIVPQLKQLKQVAGMPGPVRKAAATAMGLKGEQRIKRILEVVSEKSVADFWLLAKKRTMLRHKIIDSWRRADLDAVICPAHATPALRHRDAGDFTLAGCYSMRYNFVNFPAGVVPITRVRAGETKRGTVRDRLDRKAELVEATSEGLPIGVQVVAPPFAEERVLALMVAIEDRARAGDDFPHTPVDCG